MPSKNSVSNRKRIEPAVQKTEPAPKKSKAEKSIEEHFADLAKYREEQGMPAAGSVEDETKGKKCTAAKFIIGGQEFTGRNGHKRAVTLKVHPISRGHAETDVLQQAKDAGISGGKAILVVDRPCCETCGMFGAIKSMARQLGITEMEIHSRGKPPLKFNPFDLDVNPFKGYHD